MGGGAAWSPFSASRSLPPTRRGGTAVAFWAPDPQDSWPDIQAHTGCDMRRLIFCAALLLAGLPQVAGATPIDDYIEARNAAEKTLRAAQEAGKSDEAISALEEKYIADLKARLIAIVGPISFKGLDATPDFSNTVYEPSTLAFHGETAAITVQVSPEPIIADWLKRELEAKRNGEPEGEDVPDAFGQGIAAAMKTETFYTRSVGIPFAFFDYGSLPLQAEKGEQLHVALGRIIIEDPVEAPPVDIVLTRVADGQVIIANASLDAEAPSFEACHVIAQGFTDKAETLEKAAEAASNYDDPRWKAATAERLKGGKAYRACFAEKVKGTPFYAEATKQAQALLDIVRRK